MGRLFFFLKNPVARDHNQAACFLDNKNATWLVSLSIGCFFLKKRGVGRADYGSRRHTVSPAETQVHPASARPTILVFKKKHPMDRETNQVAFLLSKKTCCLVGASAHRVFKKKKVKRTTSKNGFRQPKIWCAVVTFATPSSDLNRTEQFHSLWFWH